MSHKIYAIHIRFCCKWDEHQHDSKNSLQSRIIATCKLHALILSTASPTFRRKHA